MKAMMTGPRAALLAVLALIARTALPPYPSTAQAKETGLSSQTDTAALAAMTPTTAEAEYGAPLETEIFPLAPEMPEFRNLLPDRARPGEVASGAFVREMTWGLGAETNRTIWFIERGGAWHYLDHMDWDKGTEF